MYAVRYKLLVDEGVDEGFRHGLIVLTRVADVGENLSQRLFVVDLHKVAVLFKFLFVFVIGVDVLAQIVVVGLLMNETLQGQTDLFLGG